MLVPPDGETEDGVFDAKRSSGGDLEESWSKAFSLVTTVGLADSDGDIKLADSSFRFLFFAPLIILATKAVASDTPRKFPHDMLSLFPRCIENLFPRCIGVCFPGCIVSFPGCIVCFQAV